MSGPIVRTGTNPKFWANFDAAFGPKKAAAKPDSEPKAAAKKAATKKAATKKATQKKAK